MLFRNLRRTSALAAPILMESGAPRTGRVHEYELCPEFAHSARHHRTANHSWRALSTCSRADYEKSNVQCHARVWRTAAVHVLANSSRVRIFSRDCSPLNATLTEVCWFALRCDSIPKIDSAVKKRALNRTRIGSLPAAIIDRTSGPHGRSADRTTLGIGRRDQPCEVAAFRSTADGHTERVNDRQNNDQQHPESRWSFHH